MAEFSLGPEVRRIVITHLASMDHMEVLVLLFRSAPEALGKPDIVQRLKRPPELVAAALTDLLEGGLISSGESPPGSEAFKYEPGSESLRTSVEELMKMYNERPVTLIRAIYDRPAQPVISFAEAFRVRGSR